VTPFVDRYENKIFGILSCFDRVVIQGTLPGVCYAKGMTSYLYAKGIRIFDYPRFAQKLRDEIRANAERIALEHNLYIEFIRKPKTMRKDKHIKEILAKRGEHPGLVHIMSVMEPCTSYKPWHDKRTHKTFLKPDSGKCLHYYFYFIDEDLGLCYLRVPTWAPFRLQFYFNGHNWLARQMRKSGMQFTMIDNAFVSIDDFAEAQQTASKFNVRRLHHRLDQFALQFCPVVQQFQQGYRWTIMQVEYATDIVFDSQHDLQDIYQPLIRHIIIAVKADNVAKFLGRKVHGNFKDQLNSDFSTRIEGTRIKHHMAQSSIKMYDKHGLVLRIETTTNDVSFFKHYRKVEHRDGTSSMKNASVLKTIYSLGVMAGLMTAANRRYLAFISSLDQPNLGTKHLDKISRPVQHNDRSYRGFNLFNGIDLSLFLAIVRGEFTINGFRNRDLQRRLRLNGSQVTRLLKRLRLHGLTKKVVRSHKYYLTNLGRRLISCVLRLREETILPALAYGY
jgi:hypothetical protein